MSDNRTTELTATDRLRVMLDEHGAEWKQGIAWNVTVINGDWLVVEDIDFGTLSVSTTAYQLTPEQAITATLGSEREKALEELVRDAYWLIVRAIWSHESQDKFAADWTERVSVLGIEVD